MKPANRPVIGWREWVGLPLLGVPGVRAKIDTGARSAALHVVGYRTRTRGGELIATFGIHPEHGAARVDAEAVVVGTRRVHNPGGRTEERPVIVTDLALGDTTFQAFVTLTSREDMGLPMLVGRHAIRRRFLVDPARSYVLGQGLEQIGELGEKR